MSRRVRAATAQDEISGLRQVKHGVRVAADGHGQQQRRMHKREVPAAPPRGIVASLDLPKRPLELEHHRNLVLTVISAGTAAVQAADLPVLIPELHGIASRSLHDGAPLHPIEGEIAHMVSQEIELPALSDVV